MDVTKVLPLDLELELAEGLDKWHAFYIPHCSAKLQGESRRRGSALNLSLAVQLPSAAQTSQFSNRKSLANTPALYTIS